MIANLVEELAKNNSKEYYNIVKNPKYFKIVLSILIILWGIWRLYCHYIWNSQPDLFYGYTMVIIGDIFLIVSIVNNEKLLVLATYPVSILLMSLGIMSSLYIPHIPSVILPTILGFLILFERLFQKEYFSIVILFSATLFTTWAVYRIICYLWWKFPLDLYYGIATLPVGIFTIILGETAASWNRKLMLVLGSLTAVMGGFGYIYLRTIHYPSALASLGTGLAVFLGLVLPLTRVIAPSEKEIETILCYYCRAEIPKNIELCPNCNNKIPICPICDIVVQAGEKTSQCPHCKTVFHKEHLDTWLMVRFACPTCGEKLR